MKFSNPTTYNPPTWVRGVLAGSSNQLAPEAGARPLFSDPLDEEVYETRFDQRQNQQMSVKDVVPTDKSAGGEDA